ncbi:hypothetical protein JCM18899A_29640 [Nocardioides sp. AN3]
MSRIPQLMPADMDEHQRELYDAITGGPRSGRLGASALIDTSGRLQGPFNAFLLQPSLGMALQEVGAVLRYGSRLPDRWREIAILVVAAHLQADFERFAHEPIARSLGVSVEQLQGIRAGQHDGLAADEAVIADSVRRLLVAEDLADSDYTQLRSIVGEAGVFELTCVVGYYRMIALQLRVLRVGNPAEDRAEDDLMKRRAAQRRSMTLTRMLDYGMDHWDATQLSDAPATQSWSDVATRLAESQTSRADAAVSRGDSETAVACYRRAAAALTFAQMEFNADSPQKRALYEQMTAAYSRAAELDARLRVERLSVPHKTSNCTAWFVGPTDRRPAPPVVIVGGQSGWGPAYHPLAAALVARGLSAVLLEAPGQGLTRMVGGLHLDAAVDRAFSATLDVVRDLTEMATPAGVWGNSLGGLLAARAAVHDDRFAACCVNGAPTDPRPTPFRNAIEQSQALLGVEGDDAVASAFRPLWLEPGVDSMSASLLVVHGGADPLVTLEQQEKFLPLSARSTLRVWDDGEHTVYNHSNERTEFVADWFRSQLTSA